MLQRRVFLGVTGLSIVAAALPEEAHATLVRGLSLEELTKSSQRILLGRALDSTSQWAKVGGRRRIVTDTRVRVEDVVAKSAPRDGEVLVRTLGGIVGDVGALVHGEAELALDQPCVVFLNEGADGIHHVTGMAQGHYPMLQDAARKLRLRASPRVAEVLGKGTGAVRRLAGLEFGEARTLIREALSR